MAGALLNDVHSGLNATRVAEHVEVDSVQTVREAFGSARRTGRQVAVAGGMHAMGGQQFRAGGVVLDTRPLNGVQAFDAERGVVEVAAGTTWTQLMHYLAAEGGERCSVAQKQSGVDRVTIGGSISVNAHGRGLAMTPLVGDVESLAIVTPDGESRRCSRRQNKDLFALSIGGYGLFGVIVSVELRLRRRDALARVVEVVTVDELVDSVIDRVEEGCVYGNAQLATDEGSSRDFLRRALLTCQRPAPSEVPALAARPPAHDWEGLLLLAHRDKAEAFRRLAEVQLATSGLIEGPDGHQLGEYADGYHERLDLELGSPVGGCEVTAELYVPPRRLADFLEDAASDLRERGANVIHANVRFVRADVETYLPWARGHTACVVFAIHTERTPDSLAASRTAVRALIDLATARGGSFFLTYHCDATGGQIETAHPRFRDFLREKDERDPEGLLGSDWLAHHRALFV